MKRALKGERYNFSKGIHAHSTIAEIRAIQPQWSDYRTAAFVRNPFERLHSIWKFWHSTVPFKFWLLDEKTTQWHNGTPYTSPIPLQERPQADWIDKNTELFWFGDLENEFGRICKLFGSSAKKPEHTHKSRRDPVIYDEEMTEFVVKFHDIDMSLCPTLNSSSITIAGGRQLI